MWAAQGGIGAGRHYKAEAASLALDPRCDGEFPPTCHTIFHLEVRAGNTHVAGTIKTESGPMHAGHLIDMSYDGSIQVVPRGVPNNVAFDTIERVASNEPLILLVPFTWLGRSTGT